VLHDVLEVLVAGEAGELVGDHLLPVAGEHLCGLASAHARERRLVTLDEEGVVWLTVVCHLVDVRETGEG
jgi:hypothetical protein